MLMADRTCPELPHFHVVYEQKGSFKRPHATVVAASPAEALASFMPTLPDNWHGGLSVFDDSIGHEDEMPMLHRYM